MPDNNKQTGKYTEEELTAFAIGELDAPRAAEIEQLLIDDAEARQTVDELRGVASVLTEQFAAEPAAELTAEQRTSLQSAMSQDRSPAPLRFGLRVPLSVAASILVLLGAAFLMSRYWPEPSAPIAGKPVEPAKQIEKDVRLEIVYPEAQFEGTPGSVEDPHVAPPSIDPPEALYVPWGTSNLAAGKTVTSNAKVSAADLQMVTDGDKNLEKGHYLDIGEGLKWVQIDLGVRANVYAVAVWHYCDDGQARAYRDVIVQVSDDPKFATYATVFSTDHDKSAGMEVGKDMGYVETRLGKVIDCDGAVGRYVRLYSKGNTTDDQNHYVEVEVHGKKAPASTTLGPLPTPTAQPVRRSRAKRTPKAKKVPLVITYPKALFDGTPVPVKEPNIRKPSGKPPRTPLMPVGTVNIALGKPVTSSQSLTVAGELDMVTNGKKDGEDGNVVDIGLGRQWVQIDLQAVCEVSAIGVWHYHKQARAYRDVIVHVSNDPDFIDYKTVFNSDHDNSSGFGIGTDVGYVETCHGKLMWCPKNQKARYVRLYSKGNTSGDHNHYVEVEVYGRTPKGKAPTTQPAAKKKAPTTQPARRRKTEKVVLKIDLPEAMSCCSQHPINEPNIEKPSRKPPEPFLVPKGTVNLASGKPVTSNEQLLICGELGMVTDGDKSGWDGRYIDIGFDLKWVQIDLQAVCDINLIAMWHYHKSPRAYRDVVVRVSNDPDFTKYATVFNADHDNSSGLGIGKDKGYVETRYGKRIDCKGVRGRYVRLYSKGNTSNDQNHYVEVEVYGRPPKDAAKPAKSS